jgi:hypothetical protein
VAALTPLALIASMMTKIGRNLVRMVKL